MNRTTYWHSASPSGRLERVRLAASITDGWSRTSAVRRSP
jgi:hypothetical protein